VPDVFEREQIRREMFAKCVVNAISTALFILQELAAAEVDTSELQAQLFTYLVAVTELRRRIESTVKCGEQR
jgi:hypothetical protein